MADVTLDCKGLVCPLPIAKVQKEVRNMAAGQTLEVVADCGTFAADIKEWCEKTNHPLISINTAGTVTTATVRV